MNTIQKFQTWYSRQCNGDWEHGAGVKIVSLDNPGWVVEINLIDTDLENRPFKSVQKGMDEDANPSETDWMHCSIRNNVFVGAGDPYKLETILQIFLDWTDDIANQLSATPC